MVLVPKWSRSHSTQLVKMISRLIFREVENLVVCEMDLADPQFLRYKFQGTAGFVKQHLCSTSLFFPENVPWKSEEANPSVTFMNVSELLIYPINKKL